MAENKNAAMLETANESGSAAITDRLDDVAERMTEAEKATQVVAEEQKLRRAEQEQHSEKLQQAEEERRAQAAEAAKSVADRRAAVLDYTENYRQNQKIAKAARSTVSKAKLERLAAEAEAKARAEREAEEALQRERDELMARRQRSYALLKKENESETEAPEEKNPVAAPADAPMPEVASAAQETEPVAAENPVQDGSPDILDIDMDNTVSADDAASADESETVTQEADGEIVFVDEDGNPIEDNPVTEKVDNDLKNAVEEATEQRLREAETANAVNEDLTKVRVASMMPVHLIPESLRWESSSQGSATDFDNAMQKFEDALLVAATQRIENVARRLEEGSSAASGAQARPRSDEELADAAVAAGLVGGGALAAAYGTRRFSKDELRRYKKNTKNEIDEKRKALKNTKKNAGESAADYEYRRLERRAALLGTQFGAIAMLSSKGHPDEAEKFTKKAEADVRAYNKGVAKYNKTAMQPITPLPKNVVERIAMERKLPENLPFGSAATGHDAALTGGVNGEGTNNTAARAEKDALQDEMQKQMLLHAMVWNPAVASAIQRMVNAIDAEEQANAAAPGTPPIPMQAKSLTDLSDDQRRLLSEYEEALSVDDRAVQNLNAGKRLAAQNEEYVQSMEGAAFLANELQRIEYYENRLAMIEVKRRELDDFYANTKHLPEKTRKAAAAERRLDLIKEELALLCLMHRYPNDRIAERCCQDCVGDVDEYNRLVSKLSGKDRYTEPLSRLLPAQVLAQGTQTQIAALAKPERAMMNKKEYAYLQSSLQLEQKDAALASLLEADEQTTEVRVGEKSAIARLIGGEESAENIRAAMEERRKVDLAMERLTLDREKTLREYNAAVLEAERLAALDANAPAAKEAKEKADALGAKAGEEQETLEMLQGAAEATDKSTTLPAYRKAAMLALAAAVAEDRRDTKSADKLRKYAAAAGKKESRAAERAEKKDRRDIALWEQSFAAAEAKARVSEESAENASKKATRLRDEKACNSELHQAYGEALRENSKADSARRTADTIKNKREEAHSKLVRKREARNAMLAFAATMAGNDTPHDPRPLSESDSRKLNEAITKASQRYENAKSASLRADEALIRMAESGEDTEALRAAQRNSMSLKEHAVHAQESLATLHVVKDAAEKSGVMTERERAEMLTLAMAVAEAEDAKAADRLKKQIGSVTKKENQAHKQAEKQVERNLERWDAQVADAEAKALLAERASDAARAKLDRLMKENADQNALRHAYEQMLLEEERAKNARKAAAGTKQERDSAQERANSHKEAMAAMLALGGMLGMSAKKGESAIVASAESRATQKLDDAIAEANARYERAMGTAPKKTSEAQERKAELLAFAAADKADKEEAKRAKTASRTENSDAVKQQDTAEKQQRAAVSETEAGQPASEQQYRRSKAAEHKEAKEAMVAFAAAFAASERKAKRSEAAPVTEDQKLDAAIEAANERFASVQKAKEASEERARILREAKADEAARASAEAEAKRLKKEEILAEDRADTLYTAKEAVKRSRTLTREEKAEMIALVMAFNADEANEKTAKKLQKKIKAAEKREAKATKEAVWASGRPLGDERKVAKAEATAQIAEKEAVAARERVKLLSEKDATKKELHAAYKEAVEAEDQAKRARKIANGMKNAHKEKKERVESRKEARRALLAFAAAVTILDQHKKAKKAKKGADSASKQGRRLELEIAKANERFERAEAAKQNIKELLQDASKKKVSKNERTTMRREYLNAEREVEYAKNDLDTLQGVKTATERSKALSDAEKAELMSLVLAANAEEREEKAAKKLKKKIAAAAKKEETARKKAAKASVRKKTVPEKEYLSREANVRAAEKAAAGAKERAELLAERSTDKKAIHKAYEDAMLAEARAESARKAQENARVQRENAQDDSESRKEANAAWLAFAAAFTASEKSKKAKKTENGQKLVSKQENTLDDAIARANERYERAEADKRNAKSKTKSEKKRAAAASDEAKTELEALEGAKKATEKSKVLSDEEKAEMLALVIAANADGKNAAAAAKLRKKIAEAEKREAKAEKKAARTTDKTAESSNGSKWDKKIAEAEAIAERSEKRALAAKKTVKDLHDKKADKEALHEAYEQAFQAEVAAERARKAADEVKKQRDDSRSHKDAREALIAFAAAYDAYEKSRKDKTEEPDRAPVVVAVAANEPTVTKQERKIDEAIAQANADYERIENAQAKRDSKKSEADAEKEERAGMLAFLAAYKAFEKAQKAEEKAKAKEETTEAAPIVAVAANESAVSKQERKIDEAIAQANVDYERMENAQAKRDSKKSESDTEKEERAGMLAFLAAYKAFEKAQKAEAKAEEESNETAPVVAVAANESAVSKQERKLDEAIARANADYERMANAQAKRDSKKSETEADQEEKAGMLAFLAAYKAFEKAQKTEAKAEEESTETAPIVAVAANESAVSKQERKIDEAIAQANADYERMENAQAKRDSKKSETEADQEEKAAMLAFLGAYKAFEKTRKAEEKAKAKEETTEAAPIVAVAANESAVTKQERKIDEAIAQANADYERIENAQAKRDSKKSEADAEKEEKAAMLAFLGAYKAFEKARKAEEKAKAKEETTAAAPIVAVAVNEPTVTKQERKLEEAIARANADYERIENAQAKRDSKKSETEADQEERAGMLAFLAAYKAFEKARKAEEKAKAKEETTEAAPIVAVAANEPTVTKQERRIDEAIAQANADYERIENAHAKRDSKKSEADAEKEERAGMLAFLAAYKAFEKAQKAEAKAKAEEESNETAPIVAVAANESAVSKQERKIDEAIAAADARYEKAEADKRRAQERLAKLSEKKTAKSERKAARKEYANAVTEAEQAKGETDTLKSAKNATKKSKTLSNEEKADMLALVLAVNADKKNAEAAAKLQRKIAEAEKREELAAIKAATNSDMSDAEKKIAEAEALAQLSESKALAAKERAKALAAEQADKTARYAAYEEALLAESKAEQARKTAEDIKQKYTEKSKKSESREEEKNALLAFAASFAILKNRKTKKQKAGEELVNQQERKLDEAIGEANVRYEQAAAKKRSAEERLAKLSAKKSAKSERKAARKEYLNAVAEADRAKTALDTLQSAKTATKKSKALSNEEKADMLALVLAANADKKNAATAERLQKKVSKAEEKETAAKKKAEKKASDKKEARRSKQLDREAEMRASEESAIAAKEKAERLTQQKADEKELHRAYKQAILEEERAERARKAAAQGRVADDALDENIRSHKEAKEAMAALAGVLAADAYATQTKTSGRRPTGADGVIAKAQLVYENALDAKAASREKVRRLTEQNAEKRERKAAFEEAVRAEIALKQANDNLQTLKAAKRSVEAKEASADDKKADMLALVMAASADRKNARIAEKIQKKADTVLHKGEKAAPFAADWDKVIAAAEAKALVSEESALDAKEKARLVREERPSRKTLYKAYREALAEEAKAEQARETVVTAKAERAAAEQNKPADRREAEAAMLAFVAAMDADARNAKLARRDEKKKAAEQKHLESRAASGAMRLDDAEAYARICEEKATRSEQKALLLVSEGGSKKEKLKAYEEALLDKAAADKAKAAVADLKARQTSAPEGQPALKADPKQMMLDIALEDERLAIERANDIHEKIRRAMEDKIRKADAKGLKKYRSLTPDATAETEADSTAESKVYSRKEIAEQEKRDMADLAKQKAALEAESKGEKQTDGASELTKQEKRQLADEKAWNLLVQRDEEIDRRNSYVEAVRLAEEDKARVARKKERPVEDLIAEPFTGPTALKPTATLTRRAMAKRIKELCKRDMDMLTAYYDSTIAEIKRSLEIGLCDLSCTPGLRMRLKADAAKQIRKLNRKKRLALRVERADNERYFECLRTAVIRPLHARDSVALAQMRERLFSLLEHRDHANARLTSLYLVDSYKEAKQVKTPWHKAFMRTKKHWQRRYRRDLLRIEDMNLTRNDKQKLRVALDRIATAYADIAEAKCRARKMKIQGIAKQQHQKEMIEMRAEVYRARKSMKRKMKAARAKEDIRNFWRTSILSLFMTAVLVVGGVIFWRVFGDSILSFLNTYFPDIMSQFK